MYIQDFVSLNYMLKEFLENYKMIFCINIIIQLTDITCVLSIIHKDIYPK